MWIRRGLRPRILPVATLLALLGGPTWAESDIFTVRGIPVDITAETAAAAREAALADGHVKAMQALLARLLPQQELARAPSPQADEVAQLVRDFEVRDERTSDVRYLASLTFRFKPEAVREFLRRNGLLFAETQSKPVLVLPVYGSANDAVLWSETNPWWSVWSARRSAGALVPTITPLGDLADITTVDAQQALAGDGQRLRRLAERYGAEDVLITQAVVEGDPEAGQARARVSTQRIGLRPHAAVASDFSQETGESLYDLLARAAEGVAERAQEAWKQENLLRPGAQQRIAVSVPVRGLDDWLEVKRRLGQVAAVQDTELGLLTRRRAELDITYVGDQQQLVVALAQSDLTLEGDPGLGWSLRLSEAPPETMPAARGPFLGAGSARDTPPAPGGIVSQPSPPAAE